MADWRDSYSERLRVVQMAALMIVWKVSPLASMRELWKAEKLVELMGDLKAAWKERCSVESMEPKRAV